MESKNELTQTQNTEETGQTQTWMTIINPGNIIFYHRPKKQILAKGFIIVSLRLVFVD